MLTILVLLGLLVLLNIAAWFGAVDSSDGINSPEWERRRAWLSAAQSEQRETVRRATSDSVKQPTMHMLPTLDPIHSYRCEEG
ncbi:MAG: hypothetical protein ACLFVO_00440 [Chloroflexaceae bacterium]